MAKLKRTTIGEFLKEREGRYDPDDKKLQGLERLNKIDFTGEVHLSGKGSKTDMIIIHPGDLVISGINVAKGAVAVYQGQKPITATIHYSSYQFDKDLIDIEYFKRFVKSKAFIKLLEVRGGIKTEIKPKHFLPIEIDLPTIHKQHEVVAFFRRIENEIGELGYEISTQSNYLTKLKQSVLQDAIKGKLTAEWRKQNPKLISGEHHASNLLDKIRAEKELLIKGGKLRKEKPLPDFARKENLFSIPDGWVWCRLGDVILSAKDGPHFSPQYSSEGIPFISTRNISPRGVDFSSAKYITAEYHQEISRKCKPEKWDILYTKGGSTGIARVNTYDIDFNVWVHVAVLKKPTFMDPFYIQHCLNSPHCYGQSQDLTHGIGNQDLGLTRMVNITTPLPPLDEQHEIVKQIDRLMAIIDELEEQVSVRKDRSELLMQSVLREAFTEGSSNEAKTDQMMGELHVESKK